jgi:predicted transposase YbfD/YdcC
VTCEDDGNQIHATDPCSCLFPQIRPAFRVPNVSPVCGTQVAPSRRKGKKTVEVIYLITSDRDADPAILAAWVRSHWQMENRLHWDVAYLEDKSLVRTGNAPRVMASLRSLAISLLRLDGHDNIAAANRDHAATPGARSSYFKLHEYDFAGSLALRLSGRLQSHAEGLGDFAGQFPIGSDRD